MDEYDVTTVILAGGQGTRLLPLTQHRCKPALSYGGRYRLIDIPISNSIHSGYRQIFVIAQYLSSQLQHHISHTYRFGAFQTGFVDVLTPEENERGEKVWFNGTADAVRKTLTTLLKTPANYFLILAGDHLYNIDFQKMVTFAKNCSADLTIASIPVKLEETKRFGILKTDHEGFVTQFVEKPEQKDPLASFGLSREFYRFWKIPVPDEEKYLASMGIYVFKREALVSLLKNDSREDFGKHLIPRAIEQMKCSTFVYDGYWEDIGTVASYFQANLHLTTGQKGLDTYDEVKPIYTCPTFFSGPRVFSASIRRSILCEGSVIEAAEIEDSVIGLCSHIKRGSVLRHAVLLGNHFFMPPSIEDRPMPKGFWIGENCLIQKAIIDEYVQIGNNVRLINQKGLTHHDAGNGVYIRDGIIVVTAGTILPDRYLL